MNSLATNRRRLLNVPQAAEYLNTKERFVRRIVSERRIDYIKVGRHVRFDQDTLDAYLDEQTVRRSGETAN